MERCYSVLEIIKEDEMAVRFFEFFFEKAVAYFSTVVKIETQSKFAKFRLEGGAYKELIDNLDKQCRHAHDTLMSDLHIFNRYIVKNYNNELIEKNLAGGIFPHPDAIHDKVAVADWVGNVLNGIYVNRKR